MQSADFLALDEIEALQRERWQAQAAFVANHSAFYRRLWGGKAPPRDLAGLAELPPSDKAMLRESQARHPPFGDYLAIAPERVSRLHRTSGTTGQAMNIALTEADARQTALVGARAQRAAGLGPGHRVVHCLNYRLWIGGYTDHASLEASGATVIPFGVGASEQLVRTIRELAITAISCTPSYPAVLEQVLAASFPGLAPRDLGLELGLFGGEAGLDDPNFRARLEETWGFKARNANYGVSDAFCNFAGQCEENGDLHFVGLDALFPELVEPGGSASRPWREGEEGELVLTHLAREAQPLVRFRTGDIVTITGTGVCACGRSAPRFRVIGRADDMVVVRGVNVFPTAVAAVINALPGLSGEYRVVLDGPGPYHVLPLDVERAKNARADESATAEAIEAAIKRDIGASARVTILPPESLPRSEGKTRRVIRKDRP